MDQANEAIQDDAPIEQPQEIEPQEEVTEAIADETETEDGESLLETQEPEFVEVEYKGEKYNVPPELKDSFMRTKDYTEKTQTVAEERRALEQQTAQFQQAAQMQQRNMQGHAQLAALQNQLQQYEGVDWDSFSEQDATGAQKAFFQYTQLKDATTTLGGQLQQQEAQALQQQQSMAARQLEQGKAELARDIEGWSDSMGRELADYGLTQNAPAGALKNIEAYQVKILRKAMLYDKLMNKATETPKTPAKPVSKVKGKAKGAPNPDKMSTEDWLKWRNKQIASQ